MPYGIQIKFLPIILRKHGVSLSNISLFKLLFLPWVFKVSLAVSILLSICNSSCVVACMHVFNLELSFPKACVAIL